MHLEKIILTEVSGQWAGRSYWKDILSGSSEQRAGRSYQKKKTSLVKSLDSEQGEATEKTSSEKSVDSELGEATEKTFSEKSVDSGQGEPTEKTSLVKFLVMCREKLSKRHPQWSLWTVGWKMQSNRFIPTQEIMTMNSIQLPYRSMGMSDLL